MLEYADEIDSPMYATYPNTPLFTKQFFAQDKVTTTMETSVPICWFSYGKRTWLLRRCWT